MTPSRGVVICGTSIFAMAIETRLADLPWVEVVRLDPYLPNAAERISALEPDAVVVEREEPPEGLLLPWLDNGFPLLELDADQGVLTILGRRQVTALRVDDLAQAIEQVAAGDPSWRANDCSRRAIVVGAPVGPADVLPHATDARITPGTIYRAAKTGHGTDSLIRATAFAGAQDAPAVVTWRLRQQPRSPSPVGVGRDAAAPSTSITTQPLSFRRLGLSPGPRPRTRVWSGSPSSLAASTIWRMTRDKKTRATLTRRT